MPTYSEHIPTAFDSHIRIEDREHWLMCPCSRTRDSGTLDRVNFTAALALLGGESETVEVHRFGHWGPGWYEIIIVDPADAANVKMLEDIIRALEDYPVLDDEAHSEAQWEEFLQSWNDWGWCDLRDMVKEEFGLSETTCDRLDDVDPGKMQEWWMRHANEPYNEDSSGIYIPIHSFVKRMTRDDCARMLWETRKAD